MELNLDRATLKNLFEYKLQVTYDKRLSDATNEEIYNVVALTVNEILNSKAIRYRNKVRDQKSKRVYYICLEFLVGRSFKNNLLNLGLYETCEAVLAESGINLEKVLDIEPDAGLGNGGLGRLASCFLDGMATQGYPAIGYSILYEYGIFKQKLVDGWQHEQPDDWLEDGSVWLNKATEDTVEVRFGGRVEERWSEKHNGISHLDYQSVHAVPYDMIVSGHKTDSVATLRLFKANSPSIDMNLFNSGDYLGAAAESSLSEAISKVLYPNDNHREGKSLRLRQQYFLCAASITDIIKRHISVYGKLENFSDRVAIHINDTHPALAIAELMRILIDECGYSWDNAWDTTTKTFAYTNHTVMKEALEQWDIGLIKELLPRIFSIICEINRRFVEECRDDAVAESAIRNMEIVSGNKIKMGNLSVIGSHSVNGVSKLHSEIIKQSVFRDFYNLTPHKFTNVTNGIAYRRWLYQSNRPLYDLACKLSGEDVNKNPLALKKMEKFVDDKKVLDEIIKIKRGAKEKFADFILRETGEVLNPDSIFDVQVKRLHEYKRQHLNALHILALYNAIKQNPNGNYTPRTYIFGAKSAPGYYLAKQIIRFICSIAKLVNNDPQTKDILKVIYLEDYSVTKSEILMPAADISEQISLAGTEASGTGNMKFMINGAITLGTLDGANVEICEAVGEENMILFGLRTDEVSALKQSYNPIDYYRQNEVIRNALDYCENGSLGYNFSDIVINLKNTDPYMVFADFDSYIDAQRKVAEIYSDKMGFAKKSLINTANAGIFAADRSVSEYAMNIWDVAALH